MEDKEQKQKTIVAFIAGLLIGGLLVWVFSFAPGDDRAEDDVSDETDQMTDTVDDNTQDTGSDSVTGTPSGPTQTDSNAAITVSDQSAGSIVNIDTASYPTTEGWVVVHENLSGELGNALGAARYNTASGLTPDQVSLLRATEAGGTYHVVLYNESGDRIFDLNDDMPLANANGIVRATFTAN